MRTPHSARAPLVFRGGCCFFVCAGRKRQAKKPTDTVAPEADEADDDGTRRKPGVYYPLLEIFPCLTFGSAGSFR